MPVKLSSADAARLAATVLCTGLALIGQSGCGGDGGTSPSAPSPAASVSAASVTSQNAAAGSAVPWPPSAKVTTTSDVAGAGVIVTFAVATGSGRVTGATVTTNSEGIATVGRWTLGPTPGTNTLTATVPGGASVTFTATGRTSAPSWKAFADEEFLHADSSGTLVLRSDISLAFTRAHLDFLGKAWAYYAALVGRSPGSGTRMLYTADSARYVSYWPLCPYLTGITWYKDARQVGACWNTPDAGRWTWVILAYKQPDFGTILHEVGHTFTQTVFPEQENFPWFKEGTGMYWEGAEEGGGFDANGKPQIVMHSYIRVSFRRWDQAGQLYPLETLLTLPRAVFYGDNDWSRQYSQAGAFIYYLDTQHPTLLPLAFQRMREGAITTNAQLINFVKATTGMTLAQLETAYANLARTLAP